MEDYKPELRRQSSEEVMWGAVLKDGKEKAITVAEPVLHKTKEIIGFLV